MNRPNTRSTGHAPSSDQEGFIIVSILIIVLIGGIALAGVMRTVLTTEITAGHAIQYSRAMTAAEGGAATAGQQLLEGNRLVADQTASEGVFTRDALIDKWWNNASFTSATVVPEGTLTGVAEQPAFVYEQLGIYAADGGTGVANLDIGNAAYGSISNGARELVLYKVQSWGVGSKSDVNRAVETNVLITK